MRARQLQWRMKAPGAKAMRTTKAAITAMIVQASTNGETTGVADDLPRCGWVPLDDPLYVRYHDEEWGVPEHDDARLFELLILEGAQAGLSWRTILHRREGYRAAFAGFEPERVASLDPEALLADTRIVRNRAKIESAIGNARAALAVQEDAGSLDAYLWSFVGGAPIVGEWTGVGEIPAQTPESVALSKDLKRRGFRFVGPTICYAFMQGAGLVDDHVASCFRRA
jgi:DNA-3-methyladenine glycosylase I